MIKMKNLVKNILLLSLAVVFSALLPTSVFAISQPQTAQTFAPRIRLKDGTSSNWAGYAVLTNLTTPQSNAVSDVKGSWVVPSVNCGGTTVNTYSATWIGIDGYSDKTVEPTGTEQDCLNGQPTYYSWYEMYPKQSFRVNLPVVPGNVVKAEVQYTGKNSFVLTLANTSTGQTFKTTQK